MFYDVMRLKVNFDWVDDPLATEFKIVPCQFRVLAQLHDEVSGSQEDNDDRSKYYEKDRAETDTATRITPTIVFYDHKKAISNFSAVNKIENWE